MWRVVLVGLCACGGIDLADYQAALADARCDYYIRCGELANKADCHAYFDRIAIEDPSLEMAVAMGKVVYDEGAADDCVAAVRELSCSVTARGDVDICDTVLEGTVADGATCAFNAECKSNACNVPDCTAACCTGTCVAARPVPTVGQPCGFECVDGAYCAVDGTCHAQLAAGAACNDYNACELGLTCSGLTATTDGTCTTIPKLGEPCAGECAEIGLVCRGTCVKAGLPGDACTVRGDCSLFYACDGSQCVGYPTLGMPCDVTCSGASWCNTATMTCEPQQSNGATCMANDECASHYCDLTCMDVPACS